MSANDTAAPRFDDAVRARLDTLVSRYPTPRAALLPALWVAQEVYGGWLPPAAMREVAEHLGVAESDVAGVATFYTMYNKEPIGTHCIEICQNISCMVLGADELIAHAEHRLGVAAGETTPDGKFTLARVECLGACCNAPALQVGGRYHENVTPDAFDRIVESLKDAPSEVVSPPQAAMPEQASF
ncbi:MAG: NADH-quinone oxidoreductase subunit NuoE [Armatimonadota bacterium]